MKILKIDKNIQPILNITKNVIKKSDNFNDFYHHENNSLFQNQLPLLMHRSRIREVMLFKKLKREDINTNEETDVIENEDEEQKKDYSKLPLSNIRRLHIRSKRLPPLCPFFSSNGDLLPEVIATSKLHNRNIVQTESSYDTNITMSSKSLGKYPIRRPLGHLTPINYKKINNSNFNKIIDINFEEFQKEILFESKYESLKYDMSEIYGHKEFYQEFINGLVEEIAILTGDENENNNNTEEDIKKEKVFEWGKNKRKIILTLNSINIKIKEVKDNNKNNSFDINFFKYNLPLNLIPLFYYKGFEKFKLFILSIIHWDEENEKFELNENIPKIINNLLINCKDLKLGKDNEEDVELDDSNLMQPFEMKKNMTINNKMNLTKSGKSSSKNLNPMSRSMNFGMALIQNTLFAGTNVDIISKKKLKKSKFNLYPKEKRNTDFLSYNTFEFFWNTSNKTFLVSIETPLITFSIPSFNIITKQFIDFELLFYLFKINFESWDFYVIKYLSSFKIFRILLSQLASVKPKKNVNFFLGKHKNRIFNCTDYKLINIITSKYLANKEDNEEKKEKKKFNLLSFIKNKVKKNEKKDENDKEDTENKIEVKNEENEKIKMEDKKEEEIKENEIKEEEKNKETMTIPTEETGQHLKTISTVNDISNKNNTSIDSNSINYKNQYNLIIEQKCFIAIVTFVDMEKSISNQYTVHFNYSHFTKFKSMEKYMKKTSFLLKFIDINYENSTIKFDYESLNAFDENKWISEVEKYNIKYESESKIENSNINKEEQKIGVPIVNSKNRAEYVGAIKGTSITIDVKSPIILLRSIDKTGKISTKSFDVFEDEEPKLTLNENLNSLDLTKNILDICLKHKTKEIDEKDNKKMADNILLYAFKKTSTKPQ